MNEYQFEIETAQALPAGIHFGTSTWTYPGWKGIIYHKSYRSEKEFRQTCLKEYGNFGLFRAVGIDRSFYRPLSREILHQFADMVPENFLWISKAWERITIPQFPKHPRYGKDAGKINPDFLNADLFSEEVLMPYRSDEIRRHTGPFVFQFQTLHQKLLQTIPFLERLGTFLSHLPEDFDYGVEIRNPELLCKDYFSVLNASGVTHVFNHWNYMPPLKTQMIKAADAGGISAPFFIARILTPRGMGYQDAVNLFQPYDSIKKRDPEMRADVVRLVQRALKRGSRAFVIVNNRAEGNSPMTINEIIQTIEPAIPAESTP